jgi:hypothetical protein
VPDASRRGRQPTRSGDASHEAGFVTSPGWIHLILGIIVFVAGVGLLAGQTWARVVGVVLAVISAVENFLFLPYYPFWAILVIAVDMMIIWRCWSMAASSDLTRHDPHVVVTSWAEPGAASAAPGPASRARNRSRAARASQE